MQDFIKMGRPAKREQRTEEILDAFQRCVAKFGLEGSTLERIAEEANLQRSLVRHFAGNRSELIEKLTDRILKRSDNDWQYFISTVPAINGADYLVTYMFSGEYSDPELILVIESLIFSASRDDLLKIRLQSWVNHFIDSIAQILDSEFPDNTRQDIHAVAFGIISLYFNLDSLSPLGLAEDNRRSALSAAKKLIGTLIETSER